MLSVACRWQQRKNNLSVVCVRYEARWGNGVTGGGGGGGGGDPWLRGGDLWLSFCTFQSSPL